MYVKHVAARVICSFLNSNGGDLIIGVRDDGSVQGLKDDFSLARPVGKDPKDYFSLEFDKLVRDYFKGVSSNINGQFIELKGELVFAITVFPSVNRPVFINGKKGKEFYVRLQASSEPFLDIEQVTEYCLNKWGSSKS
jgi:predicted HTH transcriptional regulator